MWKLEETRVTKVKGTESWNWQPIPKVKGTDALNGQPYVLGAGKWLVETVLLFRPSNTLLGPGRRSRPGDEQKIRETIRVLLLCSGS